MSEKIRNICLLGHGSTGKTSLAESILNLTGMTDRLGKVVEGNSVCDYDAEEIKRQISISTATVYAKYQGTKINILDTPGFFDFAGEVQEALRVADAGIICVSAKDGLNVGREMLPSTPLMKALTVLPNFSRSWLKVRSKSACSSSVLEI